MASGAVLLAAGQPIYAEDTWWHLGMGAAYAQSGPWLSGDPYLFDALGAPAPAAWLADLAFWAAWWLGGFQGLRVFHATLVVAVLALAWALLRRAAGSPAIASAFTAAFAALSAYRLFQLRPHLFTILGTLVVVALLVGPVRLPSWRRVVATAAVFAVWANLHGGFLVGLVLLAAAAVGCGAAGVLGVDRPESFARARRIASGTAAGFAGSLLNPRGLGPHGLFFEAGVESPELGWVADEWAAPGLLSWPAPPLLPSPFDWTALWVLVAATALAAALWLRRARSGEAAVDPAVLALAIAGAVGASLALRFSWLALLPLLAVAQLLAGWARPGIAAAAVAAVVLPGFLLFGDWQRVSRGFSSATYARPYPAAKFHAHTVWFLRDAGLEGRLFNDYGSGNFLGYWLAPKLQVFVNGSLNVPKERLVAHGAALAARGTRAGESLEGLLDGYAIDVFVGVGLPATSIGQPNVHTTAHLERSAAWIPVFRNVRSAVYLSRSRGQENLERVARFYAEQGVPFDPAVGFDVERVIVEAPEWAHRNGIVPGHFDALVDASRSLDPTHRRAALSRLTALQAVLGLYERSIVSDRRATRAADAPVLAFRRLVWSQLRTGNLDSALAASRRLEERADPSDAVSAALVRGAGEIAALVAAGERVQAASRTAQLSLLRPAEVAWLLAGYREPEAREH